MLVKCVLNGIAINCNNSQCYIIYVTGISANVKAAPEGEKPPKREEEEGEKMQANPSYLPIEMSYKSQEQQYVNVKSAPPEVADVEGHSKLQANPSYVPIEMSYKMQ